MNLTFLAGDADTFLDISVCENPLALFKYSIAKGAFQSNSISRWGWYLAFRSFKSFPVIPMGG